MGSTLGNLYKNDGTEDPRTLLREANPEETAFAAKPSEQSLPSKTKGGGTWRSYLQSLQKAASNDPPTELVFLGVLCVRWRLFLADWGTIQPWQEDDVL